MMTNTTEQGACILTAENMDTAGDCTMHDHEAVERKTRYVAPFVNVYLIDRAYGGPEEGGWWYDTGEIVRSTQALEAYQEKLQAGEQAWCDEENRHRRSDIGSVLSQGKYVVRIEDEPGESYPQTRPRYE